MYYFAYASNLNRKQMTERCPGSKPAFSAVLPNYKLIFVGWSRQSKGGVASIKPVKREKVMGAVYDISETNLKQLDKYDGDPIEAITYIKTEQSQENKPSPEYLKSITQGYKEWDIE
jgi:hypothetical protein